MISQTVEMEIRNGLPRIAATLNSIEKELRQIRALLEGVRAREGEKGERQMILYRCPICEGRGVVLAGFYIPGVANNSTNPETCKTCQGTGVLWAATAASPQAVLL